MRIGVAGAALGLLAGACGTTGGFGAQPDFDEARSGIAGPHNVEVLYLGRTAPARPVASSADRLPGAVHQACAPPPAAAGTPEPQMTAGTVALVVAAGQALVDYLFDAAAAEADALRAAAHRAYGARAVTDALSFDHGDCIALIRRSEGAGPSYDAALVLQATLRASPAPTGFEAVELKPIFLDVRRAAAQTTIDKDGEARIGVSAALSVSAVQNNAALGRSELTPLVTATFVFPATALGKPLCDARVRAGQQAAGVACQGDLDAVGGALFARMPAGQRPTVGVVAATLVETGALAELDPGLAADQAARTALRDAIGNLLEDALRD